MQASTTDTQSPARRMPLRMATLVSCVAWLAVGGVLSCIVAASIASQPYTPTAGQQRWITGIGANNEGDGLWDRYGRPIWPDAEPHRRAENSNAYASRTTLSAHRSMGLIGSAMPTFAPQVHVDVFAFGFPARCMTYVVRGGAVADRTGTRVVLGRSIYMLPTQPLWFGLLVNSIVWGSFACLVVAIIRSIVRTLRCRMIAWIADRRSLCRTCGYRLLPEQDVCPECGADLVAAVC